MLNTLILFFETETKTPLLAEPAGREREDIKAEEDSSDGQHF